MRVVVEQGRAVGVGLAGEGTVRACKEVLLSSGAIGSPRLLQLSGIGPAKHPSDVGIDVVFDQPEVGSNLQDHLDLFVIAECTGPHTYDKYAKPHWSAVAGLQYLLTKTGPVASSLFETGGFWYADKNARSPDIQFHLGFGSGIEAGVETMKQGGVTLNSAYLRPRSRGSFALASSDARVAPLIDPNYRADSIRHGDVNPGPEAGAGNNESECTEALRQSREASWPRREDRSGLLRVCVPSCKDGSSPGRQVSHGA